MKVRKSTLQVCVDFCIINIYLEVAMTFDKVKSLLMAQLNVKEDTVKPESKIVEDLGADSLDVVEMLMTLEDEFNVTVSDDEAVNLKTVQQIVDLIDAKSKKNK